MPERHDQGVWRGPGGVSGAGAVWYFGGWFADMLGGICVLAGKGVFDSWVFVGRVGEMLITTPMHAAFLRLKSRSEKMKATFKDYFILSVFTLGGVLHKLVLTYLNYPMRVVFKSSKVISS